MMTTTAQLKAVATRGSDLRQSRRSNVLRNKSILAHTKPQQGTKPEADRVA